MFLGADTGELVTCATCSGRVQLKVFACARHGRCTIKQPVIGLACCKTCLEYSAAPEPEHG